MQCNANQITNKTYLIIFMDLRKLNDKSTKMINFLEILYLTEVKFLRRAISHIA